MTGQSLPEIKLELNSGTFRIMTADAIYMISVQPIGTVAQDVAGIVEKEVASQKDIAVDSVPADAGKAEEKAVVCEAREEDQFYKEVSSGMLNKIGALAKQLNISLKDFSIDAAEDVDLGKSGKHLSDAMGQLQDINVMTENATMAIMDLTEKIQDDIKQIEENVTNLNKIDLASDEDSESVCEMIETVCEGVVTQRPVFDEIVLSETELLESMSRLSDLIGGTEKKEETQKYYELEPDVIFQTLYEFCTNEAVKKHLKTMRGDENACDVQRFRDEINKSLGSIAIEDNFADIPIVLILGALSESTGIDKYKEFTKKLVANIDSLFLEKNLPVEMPKPKEIAETGGEESEAPGLVSHVTGLAASNLEGLAKVKKGLFDVEMDSSKLENLKNKTIVKKDEMDTIRTILDESNLQFSSLMDRATKIFEHLSFQDLSGQKIKKIIQLLNHFQSELFVTLVAFDAQLKSKEENKEITVEESGELVQDEVDKMLAGVTVAGEGEEEGKRFDQQAVNEMLETMGF